MKWTRRFGALALAFCLLLTLLPLEAQAANTYQAIAGYTAAPGLTVETVVQGGSMYSWTYDSTTGILTSGNHGLGTSSATLSNLKVTVAQAGYLKFDYAMTAKTGYDYLTWKINADFEKRSHTTNTPNKNGDFPFTSVGSEIPVSAGDIVYITYSKTKYSEDPDYGQIRNLRLATGGTVTLSSSNVSLGSVSSSPSSLSNLSAGTQVTLTATEHSGQFEGWYETIGDSVTRVSGEKSFTYTVTEDASLQARFIDVAVNAVATIGNTSYNSLNAALSDAAQNATSASPVTVKLMRDAEITSNLTIPANVTLLVPYEADDMGADPETSMADVVRPKGSVYRSLTVASGVTLTVEGTLLINASLASSDTGHQGSLGGDYGAMTLNGSVVVNSGGVMKVRGMVTGAGSVHVLSGGDLHQAFEMTDWPGGSEAVNRNGKGEFPISQYYFQRVQVPLTLDYGAEMGVYAYLLVPSEGNALQLEVDGLIGTSDKAFFKMKPGSSITLGYRPEDYTTTFEINGSVELRSFSLSMAAYSISTANVLCPIPASFDITVKNGSTVDITSDIKLMTGAKLTIENGGIVNVQQGVEVDLYGPVDYNEERPIPSSSDATEPITESTNAVIVNNGTLNVNGVIALSGTRNEHISGSGTVNANYSSFREDSVGDIQITFNANGGSGEMSTQFLKVGTSETLASNAFTRIGWTFLGWSSDPDFPSNPFTGADQLLPNAATIGNVPDNTRKRLTLYAHWQNNQPATPSDIAKWRVGGTEYTDLNAAISAAGSSGTVVLVQSGYLPAGNYNIKSGVKVLIPYNSAWSYDVNPVPVAYTTSAYQEPSNPYAVLTMVNGANITVASGGQLNVGSRMFSGCAGYTQCGAPTGNSARINMNEGSSLTVYGTLYAYGFITGTGTVSAENGSQIHELFQVAEHRGGGNMRDMQNGGVFPFSQYYVQNIEAPITFKYGSKDTTHTNLYAGDQTNQVDTIPYISSGSSKGIFVLGSGAAVTRTYNPSEDRVIYDLNGNVSITSIQMEITYSIISLTVDSASYTLPINGNNTFNVHNGTLTIGNNAALLPGVRATIDSGANLVIGEGKNLYVYDSAQWVNKGYVYNNRDLVPVAYSPTRTYTRTAADLVDVDLNVNGTITANGYFVTTEDGANIHSSQGSGRIVMNKFPGLAGYNKLRQVVGGCSSVEIPTTMARLNNGGSYTNTADVGVAGTVFTRCSTHGIWEGPAAKITFSSNNAGAAGTIASQTVHSGAPTTLPGSGAYTKEHYYIASWNTAADGSGTDYVPGEPARIILSCTLYAQWRGDPTPVHWIDGDGSMLRTDQVEYNTVPSYTGDVPTKAATVQYTYAFADAWSATQDGESIGELPVVTGETSYYAVFDATLRKYTISFKNWDNSLLSSGQVEYGVTPSYSGSTPTQPGDSGDSYQRAWIFSGWSPTVTPVTGAASYRAQYTEVMRWKIRFYNADGSSLLQTALTAPGETPVYSGSTPTGGTGSFVGWAAEPGGQALEALPAANGAASYYAVFGTSSSGLEGDVTGDGVVNYKDLAKLLANYNKSGTGLEGDITGDGVVNYKDLAKLLANYNKSIAQ